MIGNDIYKFAQELWHINRSITGKGVRETLKRICKHLPKLEIKSVLSGTQVFDWTVPKEWNVKEAYIITPDGKKICNFLENNLHLVGYSIPFEGNLSLEELNLNTIPSSINQLNSLKDREQKQLGNYFIF